MPREYDVAVAGGGTAGCILAARIAERGKHPRTGDRLRVALVEGGPYWKGDAVWGVGADSRRSQVTNVTAEDMGRWLWKGWHNSAKILGGGSVHFGSGALLPRREDFIAWNAATGVGWTPEGWTDAVQEAEEMFHVHPTPPWAVSKGTRWFKAAAEALGHTVHPYTRAVKECIFCGYCGNGYYCKYDAKVSSLLAYIPIAERNGVDIIADAEIERIIIEKSVNGAPAAKGLEYTRQGTRERILAGTTIVSCGHTGTPVLLMKSGYGPAAVLGSKLLVRNDNIGRHITGDTNLELSAVFEDDIMEPQVGGANSGYCVLNDASADGVLRLRIADRMNGIKLPSTEALSELAPDFGLAHKKYMETAALTRVGTVSATIHNTVGIEGHVGLDGVITYEGDGSRTEKRLREGLDIAHEILKKMNPLKISAMPKQIRLGRFSHLHGSCRAGRDRTNSVVDADFQSHDVENLLACDMSALPKNGVSLGCGPAMAAGNYGWRRIVANRFS